MNKSGKTYMTQGERVRHIRKDRLDMKTQAEFAEALGVTDNYVSMIERGVRPLSDDLAVKIKELYPKVRIDYLLCLDGYETEAERISGVFERDLSHYALVENLIRIHGYEIDEEVFPNPYTDEYGRRYHRTTYKLTDPSGKSIRYISPEEYTKIIQGVNDYLDGQLLLLFRNPATESIKYYRGVE